VEGGAKLGNSKVGQKTENSAKSLRPNTFYLHNIPLPPDHRKVQGYFLSNTISLAICIISLSECKLQRVNISRDF